MNEELSRFVREALSRGGRPRRDPGGAGRRELEAGRHRQGARRLGGPGVRGAHPAAAAVSGAREAFLYLLLFAALYTAAISFGNVLFVLINRAFPDAAFTLPAAASAEMLRWGLAYLVISFLPSC